MAITKMGKVRRYALIELCSQRMTQCSVKYFPTRVSGIPK